MKSLKFVLLLAVGFILTGCATIHSSHVTDPEADSVIVQVASDNGSSVFGGLLGGAIGLLLNFEKDPKMKCTNGLGQQVDCETGKPLNKEDASSKKPPSSE